MSLEEAALYFDASLGMAEGVVLNGESVSGIFEASTELDQGDVITTAPTFLMLAGGAVAEGQSVVRGLVTYKVRQVLPEPPDGVLQRLVLARVSA